MIKNLKISTANCGIKYKNRDDLLLIAFDLPANVAGVFTQSSMPAAPVVWCKKNINGGVAKALLVNAGNANAFTGKVGEETVLKTANKTAEILNCNVQEVFISSTGVIGETLNAELITSAIPQMLQNFDDSKKAWDKASRAIMTTDTRPKLIKKSCKIGEQKIELVGFAKGSGMIAPNMATMLGYIFTDADISSEILQILLSEITQKTFNSITVDSDQSTNDSLFLFATKAAQNDKILSADDEKLIDFKNTLHQLALGLAKMIVIDGEGAKKLIEIEITGASSQIQAKEVAFAVANSPLVKTAIAGCDPNWGRIVMAVGKSCFDTSPQKIIVKIGEYILTKNGAKHPDYVEKLVHEYLKNSEVKISIDLGLGAETSTVWTCDLNEEYIKINKDYRS
jgi:glutamate N-acetyltransferase/amino-acid N-acetyltransferase